MPKPKVRKDPAAFDRLMDEVFALDKKHPYLGQMIEPEPGELAAKPPARKVPRKRG